jgi:hypothetical protein
MVNVTLKLFTLAAVAVLARVQPPLGTIRVGDPAPAFTSIDDAGRQVSLAAFRGKYVVLEWHEKGCPYVAKHYRSGHVPALQKEWTDRGVVWLLVNSSAEGAHSYLTAAESREYFARMNASHTAALLDADGKVGRLYGATTALLMVIVDPAGKVVYYGAIDDQPKVEPSSLTGARNYVRDALNELFGGKPVSHPRTVPYGCEVHYGRDRFAPSKL